MALTEACVGRGPAPGGRITFFARAKESNQRKRAPLCRRAARGPLRYSSGRVAAQLALLALRANGARSVLATALRAEPGQTALLGDTEGNDRRLRSTAPKGKGSCVVPGSGAASDRQGLGAYRNARRRADRHSRAIANSPGLLANPQRLRHCTLQQQTLRTSLAKTQNGPAETSLTFLPSDRAEQHRKPEGPGRRPGASTDRAPLFADASSANKRASCAALWLPSSAGHHAKRGAGSGVPFSWLLLFGQAKEVTRLPGRDPAEARLK